MTLPLPPKPVHEGDLTPDEREAYLRTLRVDSCQCSVCFLLIRLDEARGGYGYHLGPVLPGDPDNHAELEQPTGYGYRTANPTPRVESYTIKLDSRSWLELPGDPIPEWPARVAEEPDGRVIYTDEPPRAAGESGRPSRAAADESDDERRLRLLVLILEHEQARSTSCRADIVDRMCRAFAEHLAANEEGPWGELERIDRG